jgi:hypothetical protein
MLVKIGKRKRHDNSISTTRPGTPLASSHTYVAPHHCEFVTRRPWTRFHTHKEKSYCTKIYGAIGIGTRMQQKRSSQLADAISRCGGVGVVRDLAPPAASRSVRPLPARYGAGKQGRTYGHGSLSHTHGARDPRAAQLGFDFFFLLKISGPAVA